MKAGPLAVVAALALAVWVCIPGLLAAPSYDDALVGGYVDKLSSTSAVLRAFRDPAPVGQQGVRLPAYAYRPLTELSLAVSGSWLPGLRMGNLVIHLAASWMVFLLARRLVPGAEGWAAAFFLLHPIAAHAVTYVYQRSVALEALLAFATVLLYLRGRLAAAWITGLLAMTAKETAVTLPLLLAAVEWIGERRPGALKRWLPFALLPLLPALQVFRAHQAARGILPEGAALESGFRPVGSGPGPVGYLLLELPVVLGYLRTAALPFPLRFYHDRVLALPGHPLEIPVLPTVLSGLAILALLAWILLGPRRHAAGRLGAALFLAPLALESTVFPIQDLAFLHRCYPALLGAGLLFCRVASRKGGGAPALAVLALLAWGARAEHGTWGRTEDLLRRDVRSAWHRTQCWGNYAWRLKSAGLPKRASRLFRRALRSPWQNSGTRVGLACSLREEGRREEARREMEDAIEAFPRDPSLVWMSIVHALEDGDEARAASLEARAAGLPVLNPELLMWAACRRMEAGRPREAERILERHLSYYPTHPGILDLLAQARRRPGS